MLIPIETIDIFLNFSGLFKYGGRKYIIAIPPNAPRLPSPEIKVLKKPLPKIGYIFSKLKWPVFAKNINNCAYEIEKRDLKFYQNR